MTPPRCWLGTLIACLAPTNGEMRSHRSAITARAGQASRPDYGSPAVREPQQARRRGDGAGFCFPEQVSASRPAKPNWSNGAIERNGGRALELNQGFEGYADPLRFLSATRPSHNHSLATVGRNCVRKFTLMSAKSMGAAAIVATGTVSVGWLRPQGPQPIGRTLFSRGFAEMTAVMWFLAPHLRHSMSR